MDFQSHPKISYEWQWWKPKGNCWQEDESFERQMEDENWILECKNYLRERKAGKIQSWRETLQPTLPWNQCEQMGRFR